MIDVYLLPGLDGTGKLFELFTKSRPQWANPIVISYDGIARNNYSALTNFVTSKIDSSRPHILLGESFSGPIATLVAHKQNHSLKGLILSASFITSPPILNHIPVPKPLLKIGISMAHHHFLVETFLINGIKNKALLENIMSITQNLSAEVIIERLNAARSINVEKEMAELNCPVLYLYGKHDRVVPQSASQDVVSANPEARVIEFDSPHMILQCRPYEAWNAIKQIYGEY